jgi:hypothetical protein
MTATLSKLPTVTRAIKLEPDMAAAIERKLAPLSGQRLARAQDAVRRVYNSGFQGSFSELLAKYETAIEAVAKEKEI